LNLVYKEIQTSLYATVNDSALVEI